MKLTLPPRSLRANLLRSPYGIRRDRLSLSWQLPCAAQSAYRVVAAEGIANCRAGVYIYDSGWVVSSACVAVRPAGLADALADGHLYYWQVAVKDGDGQESELSEPLAITVGRATDEVAAIWSPSGDFAFLRRDFSVDTDGLDRALVTVTAASPEPSRQFVYNLYVNGHEVGVGPTRLTRTPDGRDALTYQTYDVTDLLVAGRNCIAAVGYTLAQHGFLCELTLYGEDGIPHVAVDTAKTADAWQTLDGDAIFGKSNSIGTHYFTAHACNLAARVYPFGFAKAGFDANAWASPRKQTAIMDGVRLISSDTEPVRRHPSPVRSVTTLADGTQLIDLGREMVGGLRLTLDAPCDAAITLAFGEQLASGRVKCPMNTGNTYREVWTLRAGRQTLETLGMMTFRYVEIEHCPVVLTPDHLEALEIRKPFDGAASALSTEHTLLCDLYDLTKHTVKVTSQDIYVDSQSRERGAYEGDLLINMLTAHSVEDSFAPAHLTVEYLLGHRTWPADYLLTVIFAVWEDYMATGDTSLLSDWYDTLKGNLFAAYLDPCGLIRTPVVGQSVRDAVLVDWPASERDGYEMALPYNTVFNALCTKAYAVMARIAATLGRTEDAVGFTLTADSLHRAMIEKLYDPEVGRFADGADEDGIRSAHAAQHATAFCLFAGIYTDGGMADRMAAALASDGKIRMSVYGAFFLLDGLYRTGHGEVASRLLLDPDTSLGARTWAYMMYGLGATVTSEAWNEVNKPNMTLSHPWGAAPAYLIASGIFGVTPTAPAYESFDVHPCPALVGKAAITLPTLRGAIRVAFCEADGGFSLSLTVPAGATATVYLPDGQMQIVPTGEHEFSCDMN